MILTAFRCCSTLLSFVTPYLPGPAQDILHALTPLLNLLSSPYTLLYTLYNNPLSLISVLAQTLGNIFSLLRTLDYQGILTTFTNPGEARWSDWAPLVVGVLTFWVAARSFMATFRNLFSMFGTFFRWGSIIAAIASIIGVFNGNVGQAGAGGQQNGMQAIFNGLGNAAGLGGNGANGNAAGLFNINTLRTVAGEVQSAWDKGSAQGSSRGKKRSSSSSRKTRSSTSNPLGAAGNANGNAANDPVDYATNWVKNALWKASGLQGWQDVLGPNGAQEEAKKKDAGGRGKTKGR